MDYRTHVFADIYPMLADAELQHLADDIKANGLINPILVMGDVLIDGRNRLAACKIAGVEPVFKESDGALDDDQIKSLVLSLNNSRRHLNKGQMAMALAIAYPDAGHKHKSGIKIIPDTDVSKQALSHARKVLRLTPQLSSKVMAAELPLAEAYKLAQKVEDEKGRQMTAQAEIELFDLAEEEAEKRLKTIEEAEVSRRVFVNKEATRIYNESADDRDGRLQLMREEKALVDANYVTEQINALAIADAELGDAVRSGSLTIQQGEAALSDRHERAESIRITAKLELKTITNFFLNYRGSSGRRIVGEAVASIITAEQRYAAEFMVSFLNEFAIDRADDGGANG